MPLLGTCIQRSIGPFSPLSLKSHLTRVEGAPVKSIFRLGVCMQGLQNFFTCSLHFLWTHMELKLANSRASKALGTGALVDCGEIGWDVKPCLCYLLVKSRMKVPPIHSCSAHAQTWQLGSMDGLEMS